MFKQFLQASALQFVQIDSCRVGSVNKNLALLLMAAKFKGEICKWGLEFVMSSQWLVFKYS